MTIVRRGHLVLLQRPSVRDRAPLLALVHESRHYHRGKASPPRTPAEFARYLARLRQPDQEAFIVRRGSDEALVGAIELSQIVLGVFRSAYLGYWIGAPFAGQGLMTDALRLTLAQAFNSLRLHRVEANVQPDNIASRALLRRLGFTQEGYSRRYLRIAGRWRDHERWALLTEDWQEHRRLARQARNRGS